MGDATLHRHGITIPDPVGPPIVPFPRKRAAFSATGGAWPAFPHTPSRHKGRGPRPPPLESNPQGIGRESGILTRRHGLPCRPKTILPAAPINIPRRTVSPHLATWRPPGFKSERLSATAPCVPLCYALPGALFTGAERGHPCSAFRRRWIKEKGGRLPS